MGVAFFVVQDGALLDRLFGDGEGDVDESVGVRRGGGDGEFEGVEEGAGVAVGDVDEVSHGVVADGDGEESVAPFLVGNGLCGDALEVGLG